MSILGVVRGGEFAGTLCGVAVDSVFAAAAGVTGVGTVSAGDVGARCGAVQVPCLL